VTARGEIGVATTEAVLALPVLALLIVGGFHLHGVLRARLGAERDARRAAFAARDDPHCAQRGDTHAPERGADLPREVAALADGLSAIFGYGRAPGEGTRTVRVPPLFPGDAAVRHTRAGAVITCNEPEWTGLHDALGGILERVTGL